jgi:hypothetical protein
MEAEGLHGPGQSSQGAAAVLPQLALRPQGLLEHVEVRTQALRIGVRLGADRRRPRRHSSGQLLIGGCEPRIDTGDGPSVGFICASGVQIAAALCERIQVGGNACVFARHREFSAQRIELIQILGQQRLRRAPQG